MATHQSDYQELEHPYGTHQSSQTNMDETNEAKNSFSFSSKQPLSRSEIAKKAAKTRMLNDPDAFKKMGSKGGKARHSEREKETESE